MTPERVLELLKIERECIKRNSIPFGCDRKCGECDLVQDADELLEMYDIVIRDYEKHKAPEMDLSRFNECVKEHYKEIMEVCKEGRKNEHSNSIKDSINDI